VAVQASKHPATPATGIHPRRTFDAIDSPF
jgi:hypothetical protein